MLHDYTNQGEVVEEHEALSDSDTVTGSTLITKPTINAKGRAKRNPFSVTAVFNRYLIITTDVFLDLILYRG